jgi:hypothetical protein
VGGGGGSETNREGHNYHIFHVVGLSLVANLETFTCIIYAARLPLSLSGVCSSTLWAGNCTVTPSEQRYHVGMALGEGCAR